MNEDIKSYIEKYSDQINKLFVKLRTLIYDSVSQNIEEKLWVKLPSYYIGENFVRLIPFKDHINIEAEAVSRYKSELSSFKITPKGMLQIYLNQDVHDDIFVKIFRKTLLGLNVKIS
ncbi:MAG: DUF1801 domain-containing protein [Lachnospiraceae bacterium]|nr:DUF1801 domain-containing protein [Lachnospiraceae bacterium]